jgi:Carboxypeptidase regulatory-like domain/TonB-dependent Receptor Plug Domain
MRFTFSKSTRYIKGNGKSLKSLLRSRASLLDRLCGRPAFARRMLTIALVGLVGFAVTPLLFAQGITTGTVLGAVNDPSGAVIPGAQVVLNNEASGLQLVQKSAADGSFKFFLVPIGNYDAVITAIGFANEQVNSIQVVAGATSNLKEVRLRVAGGQAEQVEVNGSAAALLETTDSQVTTTFNSESMQTLPLNNGFDTVVELIPGVVSTGADNFSNTNGDNYSVNGQSGRYNNFEIDGQSNNDNTIAGPQVFFGNQDAIEQLQVITNDYSAQYGRNAGAVENYITKSGTNAFHGSVFDLYQGQFLSSLTNSEKSPLFGYCPSGVSPATGCAAPLLPRYVENRAGATIGGPVLKNKLFFFYSTYWDRVRTGVVPSESFPFLTPDATGLATIQSAFGGDPGAAALANFGPYSISAGNPQPIAVPSNLFPAADTCSSAGICLEPVTDASGRTAMVEEQGVTRSIASPFNDQEELARLDWQPDQKDHLFLRYFYQPQFGIADGSNPVASGDWATVPSVAHSVGADWTHTFTTHFLDQIRYGFQEAKAPFEGGAFPNCVLASFGACPADMGFTGGNDDLNFGGDYLFPNGRTVKVTQIQNNATWTHGSQTLLFGGEFDYQNTPVTGIFYYNGFLNYGTLSNLMGAPNAGLPAGASSYSYLANGSLSVPFTEADIAAYFQDDWKVSPTLTLHLGMRWEFFGQAVNKLHDETVARESNPNTAFWDTSLPLSDRTVNRVSQVYTNFEPRIGLAWNPAFDRKLVVNAGYAINANPSFYNILLLISDGAPTTNLGAFLCGTNACVPSNGSILSTDFRALNLPSLPTGGDPGQDVEDAVPSDFRTPYVQTWTLGIKHQIGPAAVGEIRYVGSKTTDDFQSVDANPYLLPVSSAFPNFYSGLSLCSDPTADGYGRPNCNYSNLIETTNGGWAEYDALELNLTTQNFHGLTSTASYTFSKGLNNATDAFRSTGSGGSTIAFPQDPLNPSAGERGLSGNDFPNTLGIGFTYAIPRFVKGERLFARMANGFQLSGVYRYRTGQVYTPYQPVVLDTNTGDSSFCDGAFNADVIGLDTCRLVLSNKKAPINSVAYLNPYVNGSAPYSPIPGTPQYVAYGSDGFDAVGNYLPGTPVNPGSAHWIINNQAYALAVNNPYPGSSRSLLRGQPFSDLDVTIFKTFHVTERVGIQLSMAAYNALNEMFLGTGNASVSASNFTSNLENTSGSVPGDTSGNRFVILGGRVIF